MPDSLHILYISYDGLTDPLGQSQILPYLLGLYNKGYEITIVSFEKPTAFHHESKKIDSLISNKIKWTPLVYHRKPPVLSTLWDLFQLWRTVNSIYQKSPFHIIHCRSYITSLVGLRAKRKWGTEFIFDMRGFWADERVEGRLWNLQNPVFKLIYNFFKKKEREFLKEADHVISLTYRAKEEIQSWHVSNAPITVIPTCVDTDLFNPTKIVEKDKEALRAKLGISKDDFVLLYLGSWGTWYLTDEMLYFFSEIKKLNSHAKFLIATNDKVILKDYPHLNDVLVVSSPRNLVPLHISLAHASVMFIKSTFSKKASSATKLGEIISMRIPVITNAGWGDIDKLNRKVVLVLDSVNKTYIRTYVEGLLPKLSQLEMDGIDLEAENLTLNAGVDLYAEIYKNLK
jgi:glycosyltransferase involved in cell wall biosynthesis